nr:GntR family transcriptional regulator [uncultured Faecalimonas sp.]
MSAHKLNTMSLSEQAKKEVLRYIEGMDLEKENKLPREELLAEMIGVSRITIRQALNALAGEGIIFRRQGKGTFVNVDSLNIKVTFSPCMELTQMIQNSGYEPSVRLLNISRVKREEEICGLLQMKEDEQLVVAEKLFLADDKICAFCRDYFGMNLIGGEEAFECFSKYEDSIYKYIYDLSGEKVEWDKVEIDTVMPSAIRGLKKYVSARELGDKPYLYLKTLNYSTNDKPVVYANEYFNTSIIKFNLIRQKKIRY